MKEVGNKITRLREAMPCRDCGKPIERHTHNHPFITLDIQTAADRAKVSRETWRKLETGETIKLPTLVQITRSLNATAAELDDVVCSWLRSHAGTFSSRITIQPHNLPPRTADPIESRLKTLVGKLTAREQQVLLDAIQRPEVLNSIAHLNSMYEAVKQEQKSERHNRTR